MEYAVLTYGSYDVPDDKYDISTVECNVIVEYNANEEITNVILDDDDYSEQWNEEV